MASRAEDSLSLSGIGLRIRILRDVSQTRDKRRRNDLDLFVLALIDNGVSTPYDLKKAAGLSPGATIPVLRRLLESRMVLPGKPGARGRRNHKITAEGRRYLQSGWKDLVTKAPAATSMPTCGWRYWPCGLAATVGGQLISCVCQRHKGSKTSAKSKNRTGRRRFHHSHCGTGSCARPRQKH